MSSAAAMKVSLLLPRSHSLTDANKTGSWSFIQPCYLDKTAPCSEACPCAQDIPRIEMLASRGLYAQAFRTILEENPLPGVCGRVCFHPCKSSCNRAELDEAVSINELERFLSDTARDDRSPDLVEAGPSKGKRVAILGGGPAGLSAAYFLARLGYSCELFESAPELGGLLRYGIPAYRLPPEALERDIERITRLGVAVTTGRRVDAAFLRKASAEYDAVLVACGNALPSRLGVPGEELAEDALAFLARSARLGGDRLGGARSGAAALAGKRVAVIGGGNSAVDAARSALRLGASSVSIVYRRRREDMPAFADEVEQALAEGARLLELRAPASLARKPDGSIALGLAPMRQAEAGKDGRRRVEPSGAPAEELAFDAVYAAVGAGPDPVWAIPASALSLGRCAIDASGRAPVAYLGDLASGALDGMAESVADAIGSGKEAALALDAFFAHGGSREAAAAAVEGARVGGGVSVSIEVYRGSARALRSRRVVAFADVNTDYFDRSERERGPGLPAASALRGFAELRGPLSAAAALAQAGRCFNCGLCNDCDNCRTFCPEVAVVAGEEGRKVDTDYCKGCGICVTECPRSAMSMEESRS